jgi:hypothetical protein
MLIRIYDFIKIRDFLDSKDERVGWIGGEKLDVKVVSVRVLTMKLEGVFIIIKDALVIG